MWKRDSLAQEEEEEKTKAFCGGGGRSPFRKRVFAALSGYNSRLRNCLFAAAAASDDCETESSAVRSV
jgi:hypothetical protein